jgi:phosphoglucomutase
MRKKGLGKALAAFRVRAFELMREGDATWGSCEDINMIARVAAHNEAEIHLLQDLGWKRLSREIWEYKSVEIPCASAPI